MICVIDRKGTTIEYQAGCIYIKQGRTKRRPLPINQLEQVIVYGNPLVETSVWRNLAEASVPVIMLSSRGKPQTALLGSSLAVRLPLRRMQHRLANIPEAATSMARWFIRRKFKSYSLALATLSDRFSIDIEALESFSRNRVQAENQLDYAENVAEVMGIEGRLAHVWFNLLTQTLPVKYNFTGRNRRPPRDPVNSLLSLGYTMLVSEVRQAILIEGFDPSLGFLHQDYPGREALALDFMEILRTGVDDFVFRWLDETDLNPSSFFYRKKDGCRLSKGTRPLFFQAWAQHRENWPRFDSLGETGQKAPIRELLLGQTAKTRQYMIELEDKYVFGKNSIQDEI